MLSELCPFLRQKKREKKMTYGKKRWCITKTQTSGHEPIIKYVKPGIKIIKEYKQQRWRNFLNWIKSIRLEFTLIHS